MQRRHVNTLKMTSVSQVYCVNEISNIVWKDFQIFRNCCLETFWCIHEGSRLGRRRKVWQSESWRRTQPGEIWKTTLRKSWRQTGNKGNFLPSTDWGEEWGGRERLIDFQLRSATLECEELVRLQTSVHLPSAPFDPPHQTPFPLLTLLHIFSFLLLRNGNQKKTLVFFTPLDRMTWYERMWWQALILLLSWL